MQNMKNLLINYKSDKSFTFLNHNLDQYYWKGQTNGTNKVLVIYVEKPGKLGITQLKTYF